MDIHAPSLACTIKKYGLRDISSTAVYHQSRNHDLPSTHHVPHFSIVYTSSSAEDSFLLTAFAANNSQTSLSRQQHFFRILFLLFCSIHFHSSSPSSIKNACKPGTQSIASGNQGKASWWQPPNYVPKMAQLRKQSTEAALEDRSHPKDYKTFVVVFAMPA